MVCDSKIDEDNVGAHSLGIMEDHFHHSTEDDDDDVLEEDEDEGSQATCEPEDESCC